MNKKIWIKTNGNGIIATGHIRRCMTIAEELTGRGADVKFILSDEESLSVFKILLEEEKLSFSSHVLGTVFSDPMGELPVLSGLFEEEVPDFLLVDSLFVTSDYIRALTECAKGYSEDVKIGYIDDFNKMDCPLDLIINYDLMAASENCQAKVALFGGKYAPLRKEFRDSEYCVKEKASKVFLSSGGTDPFHIILNILGEIYEADSPYRGILDFTGISCEVIIGALFDEEYKNEIYSLAQKHDSINVYEGVENMAEIMQKCDFAVSAGGNTLYELCAVGVPTVVYSIADSQLEFAKGFDKAGAAKYAGDARKDHRLVKKIITWGTAAIDNQGFRGRMSQREREAVDGKGAERIADAIMKMIGG